MKQQQRSSLLFIFAFSLGVLLCTFRAAHSETEKYLWNEDWTQVIEQADLSSAIPTPEDIHTICPNYAQLSGAEKEKFWVIFFKALAFAESSWNPVTRYVEKTMGKDKITGLQIASEGLLQVSYQDKLYYGCEFDWSSDQALHELDPKHPKKSIFHPETNLECGLKIFKKQITNKGKIFTRSYWSPLSEKRSSNGYKRVMERTRAEATFCR